MLPRPKEDVKKRKRRGGGGCFLSWTGCCCRLDLERRLDLRSAARSRGGVITRACHPSAACLHLHCCPPIVLPFLPPSFLPSPFPSVSCSCALRCALVHYTCNAPASSEQTTKPRSSSSTRTRARVTAAAQHTCPSKRGPHAQVSEQWGSSFFLMSERETKAKQTCNTKRGQSILPSSARLQGGLRGFGWARTSLLNSQFGGGSRNFHTLAACGGCAGPACPEDMAQILASKN